MEKEELLKTLEALHAELQNADSVDEETRGKLTALTEDIRRLSQPVEQQQSAEEVGILSGQIQDMMLKFETEHPALTRALNQVSSALANLGI